MTAVLLNNRYQVLQSLGRGGFGETFLAIDTHMPSARKCAIKRLQPSMEAEQIPQWLQERFQREAAILEELGENQPQIPRLYAYFCEGGNFYLVQEWIEGATLSQQQQQQGNLSATEVQKILLELLPVLDYIHSRHIIHRDIKPDNIILRSSDRQPVLIDFGIVKEAIATAVSPFGKTAYSAVLGTPGYMASEQAAGRPVYSSDLYSLGLTAIFLLTGKTPQYLSSDPQTGEILWRQELPNLQANLAAAIEGAVRFHPRDRFASAKEMLAALQTPREPQTAATVAVAPGNFSLRTQPTKAGNATAAWEEPGPSYSWLSWLLLVILFSGAIVGGLTFGFMAFNRGGNRPNQEPTPGEVFDSEPQTFPTPEYPAPRMRRTGEPPGEPAPESEVSPTPEPEVSPTPEPEATLTPEPEVSPTPKPEATATPEPEVSPTPKPEVSPTPKPEVSPTPKSKPIPVPTPESGNKVPEITGEPTPNPLPANP